MDARTQFHTMPDGRRIAFRHNAGRGPALVFLPGYMSDMAGGKASALFAWAEREGRACLLLDYSGCGESGGDFDGHAWITVAGCSIDVELRADSHVEPYLDVITIPMKRVMGNPEGIVRFDVFRIVA